MMRPKAVADAVIARRGVAVPYRIGTMIELPRACVVAAELAAIAQFFSFGTNDLTQTVYGYSRDDAEASFIPKYLEQKILKDDPFQVLDRVGVGALMRMGIERGRAQRPDLKIGICGEHGGEPASVAFCDELKLDYVSCSPYRVPIARIVAAAQAAARRSVGRVEAAVHRIDHRAVHVGVAAGGDRQRRRGARRCACRREESRRLRRAHRRRPLRSTTVSTPSFEAPAAA